jgi:hypothetical protein
MDTVGLNEMIRQIQRWHSEVMNERNDGWTKQAYRDRLDSLHAKVSTVMESLRPSEQPEESTKE